MAGNSIAKNCGSKARLMAAFMIVLVGGSLSGCAPKLAVPQFSESLLDKGSIEGLPSTEKLNQSDVRVPLPTPFKEAFELEQQQEAVSSTGKLTGKSRRESAVEKESQNQIRLSVNVYKYAFEPDTITIPYGRNITITFQSMDVRHGIAIPDFGINEPIPAEDFVRVHFESTKRGTFPFFSSVYSGPEYKNMKGTITII
ncbi:cupredoxin domain-containing protein [Candidatus Woesearchaeota archaeon]|nr:cupredoxin domain-containing protein [Candidatus Woesearchaeota archaeon]